MKEEEKGVLAGRNRVPRSTRLSKISARGLSKNPKGVLMVDSVES